MELTSLTPSQMAGLHFSCPCGREHSVGIRQIEIGPGVLSGLAETVSALGGGPVFLLADENTWQAAGERASRLLREAGVPVHCHLFPGSPVLVPDETTVGAALAAMEPDDRLLLAVGSGTLNDTARILSARCRIPYVICATAPSMDGFASTVSPLILGGSKVTKPAVYPAAILADTLVMKEAPAPMLTAGFGDIIGKYTALADWKLARDLKREYYCEQSVALMERAVENCAQSAARLKQREETAVRAAAEALVLSGVAMGLVGYSRPASGAEHHMAHYWEVDALRRGEAHPLHGNAVGAAAVVSATLYELAKDELPEGFPLPDKQRILAGLKAAGAAPGPRELGISRELFHRSVLHAMEIRERYTILRFCDEHRRLEEFAEILTGLFYR